MGEPQKIILGNRQSTGDLITLSAVPRDLHRQHPGKFQIYVDTAYPEIWENNPNCEVIGPLGPTVELPGYRRITMHYPAIDGSNRLPRHFIDAWFAYLSQILQIGLRALEFRGDIHLSESEKTTWLVNDPGGNPIRYWVILAGSKLDFTAKLVPRHILQDVVYRFRETFGPGVRVVQIGSAGHFHPKLHGVIDMVGKTTLRQVFQLIHHADGCIGPNSFLNHASAAVPIKRPMFMLEDKVDGAPENLCAGPPLRPNIVLAGGREPVHWFQYPGSQVFHTIGAMDCCAHGGCFRSRAMKVGDGDEKDTRHTCLHPVELADVVYPACLASIKPERIFEAIMGFYGPGRALQMP